MNSNNLRFIILLLILNIPLFSNLISIPFKLKIIRTNNKLYNSTNFFNDYFIKYLILELNIGTPTQKTNSILSLNSSCFKFNKDVSNNSFYPFKSSSFKIYDQINENTHMIYAYDMFNFQNIQKGYKLSFLLGDNENIINIDSINNAYIPIIGLNFPYSYFTENQCPNFIYILKEINLIKKLIWTIKYNNKYDGEFIIGDDLSGYDPIKYPNSIYYTTYFNKQFSISFESIYIRTKMNRIENIDIYNLNHKLKEAYININSGFIIGTNEYKNYIDKHFFNRLIKVKICKRDIINFQNNTDNNNNKKFSNYDYYLYSCSLDFIGMRDPRYPTTNYYDEFPSLIFSSKALEYNFELKNGDLFEIASNRYYFLIIFKINNDTNDNDGWYLGEPFYKKYPFSVNLDAKTIGFYLYKEEKNKIINNTKNIDKNNKTTDIEETISVENKTNNKNMTENKNENMNKVLKYIIEIIIGIGLLFIAYYIGVRVRERRRKRANELKDDNYEYIPEKNKDINVNNNSKTQKFVELNSKLGL